MTVSWPLLLAVAGGGALGSVLRFLVTATALRLFGSGFPWGTLTVNVLGSLAMGFAAGLFARHLGDPAGWRAFIMVGLLGGFTTFSAFSLDAIVLIQRSQWAAAVGYGASSVLLSVLALAAGLAVARMAGEWVLPVLGR